MDVGATRVDLSRLPLWAAGVLALLCGAILAFSGWGEWTTRNAEVRNAEIDLANLARSLTQHVEDTFELADSLLRGVVAALETDDGKSGAIARLQTILKARKATLGRIRGVFAYDGNGDWLATTEDVTLSNYNNADRDYFAHHRTSADRSLLIGHPVQSKSGGQWVITLSRRWNHSDGSFGGVVLATVDVAYFAGFYRQFDVGQQGTISLMSRDGSVLADNSEPDSRTLGHPVLEVIPYHPASGTLHFRRPGEMSDRIGFYQHAQRYPFLILATRTEADVLAEWKRDAFVRFTVQVSLLALVVAIGMFLVKQLLRRQQLSAALAAKEENFRLLAEGSSDIVTRIDLDECIGYVSPSTTRVLGWHPSQLLGKRAISGVNPLDRPQLQEILDQLRKGAADEARATYRMRRRDKSEIWVEATIRATRQPNGELDGFVAVTRDVTQQKTLQGRLETLAIEDGLTGLANRRRFDERLMEEWGRAYREKTSLALLMIDIDHFKAFNDTYGHPAGDECLHTVASVLADEAQRSSDLVARYGGEEFALLLPNTDAAGCARLGERIRRALHEAGIVHAHNPPGIVTASIGGAVCRPGFERSAGPASLIESADRALYAAKDGGRDRLVMAGEVVDLPSSKAPATVPA
ncbi:diguanylate cyclase [Bradyrhizobium sp. SSBR45G]|uniref:diguanylate cyclase n=1 Tax=unclassified Bradyrhizobium TaxID=2631580 RepID=UPI002342AC29|nr:MULTISPECIES: diguanylate cyclase [unclassified Bradyrhizobium]GLH80251.1 diguanylate cyclase [Bradyrhizobium sp. SSBR45G]GLH87745.1 diguanylate cyclase [Bradyrhizobium sp. SSBR45R]